MRRDGDRGFVEVRARLHVYRRTFTVDEFLSGWGSLGRYLRHALGERSHEEYRARTASELRDLFAETIAVLKAVWPAIGTRMPQFTSLRSNPMVSLVISQSIFDSASLVLARLAAYGRRTRARAATHFHMAYVTAFLNAFDAAATDPRAGRHRGDDPRPVA